MSPARSLSLTDGTFLVVDSVTGMALRLGSDLVVQSDLARKRVVAVDAEELSRKAYEFTNAGDQAGIDWSAYFDSLLHRYCE